MTQFDSYLPACRLARFCWPLLAITVFAATPRGLKASEGHDHSSTPVPAAKITSMEEAVNAAAYFQREVDAHIAAGKLDQVHASAFAARDAASSTTQFAGAMPQPARDALQVTLLRIASLATELDKYGDTNRPQEAAAYAEKFREQMEALQRTTGVVARPDWKPVLLATTQGHGGHGSSKCPHKANHGGRFTLALNDAYHVEGSYPAPGEFRMHFYDKESCPIPAGTFTGRLLLTDGRSEVPLQASTDGNYLVGKLPVAANPPVSVTAIVNLPHPQTGAVATEHYSYNFYKLSKPPVPGVTGNGTANTTSSAAAHSQPAH